MDLKDFEAMVLRERPTEITAEVVAEVRAERAPHGSAANPKLAPIPGRPPTGLMVDMFAAEMAIGELTYRRAKPSDERWTLQT
jgi:hypothetical protein